MTRLEFGQWLKAVRVRKGISQRGMAESLGLKTSQAIANIERGTNPLAARHIGGFCEATGLKLDTVVDKLVSIHRTELLRKAG